MLRKRAEWTSPGDGAANIHAALSAQSLDELASYIESRLRNRERQRATESRDAGRRRATAAAVVAALVLVARASGPAKLTTDGS